MASSEMRGSISRELGGVEPLRAEVGVGGLEGVVCGLHLGHLGLVEHDADGRDDLVSEVHAREIGQFGREVGVHPVGPDGQRTERTRYARALQGVETARGVAGGVGGYAVALDDGGLDASLGEVVAGRAARGSAADYDNVFHSSFDFLPEIWASPWIRINSG